MHISGLNGLLLTAPVLVQCLDQVELEAQQPVGIAPYTLIYASSKTT